jgi:hypothetical protein
MLSRIRPVGDMRRRSNNRARSAEGTPVRDTVSATMFPSGALEQHAYFAHTSVRRRSAAVASANEEAAGLRVGTSGRRAALSGQKRERN